MRRCQTHRQHIRRHEEISAASPGRIWNRPLGLSDVLVGRSWRRLFTTRSRSGISKVPSAYYAQVTQPLHLTTVRISRCFKHLSEHHRRNFTMIARCRRVPGRHPDHRRRRGRTPFTSLRFSHTTSRHQVPGTSNVENPFARAAWEIATQAPKKRTIVVHVHTQHWL